MTDGQHRAKVVVTGEAKGASKEVHALASQVARLEAQLEKTNAKGKKTTSVFDEIQGGLGAVGKSVAFVAGGAGVGALVATFAHLGSQLASVSEELMLKRQAVQALGFSVADLETKYRGLIKEETIAAEASKLLRLGVVKTKADIAELTDASFLLAQTVGVKASDAFADITNAIEKGSAERLRAYGITIDTNIAYQAQADALGITVGRLTDLEKKQAVSNALMKETISAAAGLTDNTTESEKAIQSNAKAWDDWKDSVSGAFVELGGSMIRLVAQNDVAFASSKEFDRYLAVAQQRQQKYGGTVQSHMREIATALKEGREVVVDMAPWYDRITAAAGSWAGKIAEAVEHQKSLSEDLGNQGAAEMNRLFSIEHRKRLDHAEEMKRIREAADARRRAAEQAAAAEAAAMESRLSIHAHSRIDPGVLGGVEDSLREQQIAQQEKAIARRQQLREDDLEHEIMVAQRRTDVAFAYDRQTSERLDEEFRARAMLLDFKIAAAQTEDERLALTEERVQLTHENTLRRIEEEITAQQAALERRRAITQETIQLSVGMSASMSQSLLSMTFAANDAARSARLAGESEAKARKRSVGDGLITMGRGMLGQSLALAAGAVADAASFNFVGAGLKVAAAATLASVGGVVIGRGRTMVSEAGGGGSFGGVGGSSGVTSLGGGSSAPAPPPATNTAGIPTSSGRELPAPMPQAASQTGTTVVVQGDIVANGSIDRDFTLRLAKAIDEVRHERPGRN